MDKDVKIQYQKLQKTDEKVVLQTLSISKEIYERELDRSNLTDNKSSTLLSVIGIIVGLFFFGSRGYSEISSDMSACWYYAVVSLSIIASVLLLIGIFFLVNSLRPRPHHFVGEEDIYYIHSI